MPGCRLYEPDLTVSQHHSRRTGPRELQMNGTHGAIRKVGSGVVAAVPPELSAGGWAPSVEQLLTQTADEPLGRVATGQSPPILAAVPQSEPSTAQLVSSGARGAAD